jgi:hypothetical protein
VAEVAKEKEKKARRTSLNNPVSYKVPVKSRAPKSAKFLTQ